MFLLHESSELQKFKQAYFGSIILNKNFTKPYRFFHGKVTKKLAKWNTCITFDLRLHCLLKHYCPTGHTSKWRRFGTSKRRHFDAGY